MKFAFALAFAAIASASFSPAFTPCKQQDRFNIMMCTSHMCTDCVLDFCMVECQKLQEDFPGCRCEAWPEARESFSGGEFQGRGKVGDVGDYSRGEGITNSTD